MRKTMPLITLLWSNFLALIKKANVPTDFLSEEERNQGSQDRDPFKECFE